MACRLVIHVCVLAMLTSVVSAAQVVSQEEGAMMRRQKSESMKSIDMGAHGELMMHKTEGEMQPQTGGKETLKPPGETSYCDEVYPRGTDNSNDCITGVPIERQEDCRHAAGAINLPTADPSKWLINDGFVNPNPYPKNCFIFQDTVFFNPTESNRTSGWTGTPICQNIIYKNGTTGLDSDATSGGCTGDYEAISSYAECEWAHDCQWGNMYCQITTFANNAFTSQDAPRGCYRNSLGCYGYNAATAAVTGTLTGMTPVCRLSTYVWTDPGAAHPGTVAATDANTNTATMF